MIKHEETRVKLIEKEIEFYKDIIQLIPKMETVFNKFDRKVISNKRFIDALDEIDKNYWFNFSTSYQDKDVMLKVRTIKNYYVTDGDDTNNTYDLQYIQHIFYIPIHNDSFDIFTKNESGNYRMNASIAIEYLYNKCKQDLLDKIQNLYVALEEKDKMIQEHFELRKAIEDFNSRYDWHVRDIFGCAYTLRREGSIEYQR